MSTELTILQAKRFGIFACSAEKTLGEVARHMQGEDISALVVTDAQGYLVGVISRSDLVRAYCDSPEWSAYTVGDYMSRDVVTVTTSTLLQSAAELLREYHIHRVVVVEEKDGRARPIAVVSASDVLYHMVATM